MSPPTLLTTTTATSSSTSTTRMTTPRPRLDLFNDSPCLVAKKCRTSTPSMRPPKPPTKSARQIRRQRSANHTFDSYQNNQPPNVEIICKIGSGYFADVYKIKSLKDGQYYALKKILTSKLQEVRNHQLLPPHPNCVKYYDSWEEEGFICIQTELCKTSLNQLLETSEEHKLPEKIVWGYLLDLLSAVKHLHDHDLLHLDIKPDNIFISFDNTAKLGDFGLMCNCLDLNSSTATTSMMEDSFNLHLPNDHDDSGIANRSTDDSIDSIDEGDSKYLASETMQGKFTKAADIFSLGITIFEVASGLDLPQRGEIYHKLRHNEIDDLYFNGLSKEMVQIIKSMMEEDYTKRPTIDELLELDCVRSHRHIIL